jgi:molybdopterin-guanine dinucleotide biosynthesis protein A
VIVAGVVLAGGLARRMGGGDKGMRSLCGRPLIAWTIERAQPQVTALALNANGNAVRFSEWGLPVVPDGIAGYPGPLAGVLAGLEWAAEAVVGATHVASFATDAPFLPRDLVSRLAAAVAGGAELACAASGGQAHPVFGLWPLALSQDLRRALEEGIRKVDQWTGRYRLDTVEFAVEPVDPFFNVNRPEDLAAAERLAALAR